MNALPGMEKFSHLEDKIYLMIDFARKMRDEKERLEREATALKRDTENANEEKKRLENRVAALLSERDTIQMKVEAMLDAITVIDSDIAQAAGR